MNILILNWRDPKNPKSGGAEYVTLQHAKGWVNNGERVTWFTSMYSGALNEEVIEGIRVVRQGSSISVFFYAMVYYFFHGKDIDVIVDEVHGIPFFAKFYARIPIIVFVHEVAGIIWDVMYPFPVSWIGKMFERFYLWVYREHYFWTDATSTKRELISFGVSRDRCVAISCPIGNTVIAKLPIKNTVPTFLFVGRVVRMKGVEDILNAFTILHSSLPTATLWMVGDGDSRYIQVLHDKVKEAGLEKHVVWWGKVGEKKKLQLMAKAHVLLHASVKEGWGLVVLEAASQGTPTVAYPSGALRDTIIDRQTGILTVLSTPEDLATQAFTLYNDKITYSKMQKRGLLWSTSFTWNDATKQSLALLHIVVD